MAQYFQQPYPARAAVGVASLPRGALVEIEAILVSIESRDIDAPLNTSASASDTPGAV